MVYITSMLMVCQNLLSAHDDYFIDLEITVGTLPAGFNDPLQPDGLAAFNQGLKVQTCAATPSLGTSPPTPSTTSTTSLPPTTTPPTTTPPTTTPPTTTPPTTPGEGSTVTITVTETETQTRTTTVTGPCTTGGGGGGGGGNTCAGGTGPGNYIGLCNFCCQFGYCPPGPCTCTQFGVPLSPPPSNGANGRPLPGEDDSYLGLCSFACSHGYCPPTACTTA